MAATPSNLTDIDAADWPSSFARIRETHDRAYTTVDLAIKCEESETPQLAIINYKLSVMLIDEALAIPVGLPAEYYDRDDDEDGIGNEAASANDVVQLDETWNEAIRMVQKMIQTRVELEQRIATLTQAAANKSTNGGGDSASRHSVAVECPWNHAELSAEMANIPTSCSFSLDTNDALQLIFTCDNVRLYNIRSNGEVTTSTENSVLRILCMSGNAERQRQATYFMQIIDASLSVDASPSDDNGDHQFDSIVDGIAVAKEATAAATPFARLWIYPLVAGVSPCLYSRFGAFIFPDLYTADMQIGTSVGIVVEPDAEVVLLEVLNAILLNVVREKRDEDGISDEDAEHKRNQRSARSERMSDGIVKGATYISRGLVFSSTKVGEFVERNTPYVISKMTPLAPAANETTSAASSSVANAPIVSRGMVTGIEVAKSATGVAASMSGYVADKVGVATMALGRFLAPHVQKRGTQLLSHTMGYSQEEAADKMSGVLTVAAGAVEGVSTVYAGLEESASLLGNSLGNNTVRIVEHKYGSSAGEFASGAFDTIGNVINISQNVSVLTPKSLAKRTAKNAGKAMVQAYRPAESAAAAALAGESLFVRIS